ncbi:DUF86 domain-containing protein [Pedobacter sp. JCM 36344]|uniref:HepT-like ribonuclease domain-containing protein n=1 Tax=Pedobacter sp. JCM 36344 TaxID=3374280 RepID=UPI003979527F
MKGRLGDKVRLQHILNAINEIENYLDSVTFEQFHMNSEKRFATIKQLEIIGEASNAISDELKSLNDEIPWKPIIGFRNMAIHEYFGINLQLVWEITDNDLPPLKEKMQTLLNSLLLDADTN